MALLRKLQRIFAIFLQSSIEYRAEMVLWRIIDLIPILALVAVWSGIFQSQDSVAGLGLGEVISYYLIGFLISSTLNVNFEEYGITEINRGEFSRYLLQPFNYHLYKIIGESSWRFLNIFLNTIPLFLGAFVLLGEYLMLPSLTNVIALVGIMLIGFSFEVLLCFFIILVAFYYDQAKAFSHLKWMLNFVLAGQMLPISLYPESLQTLIRWLPFQYTFALPTQIYLGNYQLNDLAFYYTLGVIWLIGLAWLLSFMWQRAIRSYSAVSG